MKSNFSLSPSIVPTLRYRKAAAAIEWLCTVFGFEKHMVVLGENGKINHAQLMYNNGMIMVSDEKQDEYPLVSPVQLDGVCTQSVYIIVEEIEAHYLRTKASGADIVVHLKKESYGGLFYTCRDIEGHLWNFGSYDPWDSKE